jgi:hypothetical protein
VTPTGGTPDLCITCEEVRKKVLQKLTNIDSKSLTAIFKYVQDQRPR